MADQLTPAVLPAYGGRARTPHIDALAERGVVFANAYCNSPLCAPSRAVMLTGRLPSATGAYDNAADFSVQTPTFAHYLRLAGYRTILAGKMHLCGADQLHGFEARLTTDIYPADLGWTPDWTRPDERPDWYHSMDSVTQAGPCARTNQIDFDEEVVWAARQCLFDIARGNDTRPFCMVVSLTHPHDPFTIPEPWWSRHDEAAVGPPRVARPADDPHARRLRQVIGLDLRQPTEAQVMAARRAYFGAVSFVDDQFGAVLTALRDARLAEDTIVVVLADHGEMLGEHGLWFKMSFREAACRIPLVLCAPGRFAPARIGAAVSSVDLLPTLAEIAHDGARPDYATAIDGHSLLAHVSGGEGHDEAVGEYLAEGVTAPMVMIRRGAEKFIHCPGDPDQLFALDEDPDETRNRAAGWPQRTASLLQEANQRWDFGALRRQVLASQARRRLVAAALATGERAAWDWQPRRDASRMYVRSHMKLDDIEAMARFPRA
jgi:choline-sulfatase